MNLEEVDEFIKLNPQKNQITSLLKKAKVIIVVAGMEGALPSVVAGLVDKPVIGVPVSTGYGYMGHGQAALASMLQSCAVITVVNIDAGFTAGAFATAPLSTASCAYS